MRLIVCGGRDFDNSLVVRRMLFKLHEETPIKYLFHGNARGADAEADRWAREFPELGVRRCPCPADWSKHGKAAGPIRNKHMLGQGIDLVLAFPGGRGTRNMVKQARAAGVKVIEVTDEIIRELTNR